MGIVTHFNPLGITQKVFKTTWNISAGLTIYFPFVGTAPSNSDTVIAWGDGTTTTLSAGQVLGTTGIAHTYTLAGIYNITVYNSMGKIPKLEFITVTTSKNAIKSIDTPMLTMYNGSSLAGANLNFYSCNNLQSIHINIFKYNQQFSTFSQLFNASGLLSLNFTLPNPSGITSFYYCFTNCNALQTIRHQFFGGLTICNNYERTFYSNFSLKLIADLFCEETEANMSTRFASLSSISFYQSFYRTSYNSSAVGGTAPQLWNYQYNEVVTLSSTTGIVVGDVIKDSVTGAQFTVVTVLSSTTLKIRYLRWGNLTGTYTNFVAGHTILINDVASVITFTSISGSPIKTGCCIGNGNNTTTLTNYADIPYEWKN